MINLENFDEAFKYIGSEVVVQIIDMFIEEHKDDMMLIEECILTDDLSNLKFHAHHLKGSIAIFMDAETTELAGKLEEMAEIKPSNKLPETFAELQVAVKELVCELQNKRNELLP